MRPCRRFAIALLCLLAHAALADTPAAPERLVLDVSGQPLTIWSRRPEHAAGAIVLVHGLTWSARPAFDFEPRMGSRSLLKALAAAGLATYALDLPGYGASPRPASGWLSPESAAADVEAVAQWVAHRHPDVPPPVLLGWSRGSKIAALVATRARQPLTALILYAFNLDLAAAPINGPPSGKAPAAPNTQAWARTDFVSPDVASPQLIEDFVAAALAADPVKSDVCCDVQLLAIRPEAIRVPVLLLHGARDPAFRPAVAGAFFARLGSAERRWVVVGRGAHAAHLEDTAPEVVAAMTDFIRAALAQAPASGN